MSALPRPALRRTPLAGGVAACGALLAALLVGPGGTPFPSIALGLVALAAVGLELGRRAAVIVRSERGPQLLIATLGSAAISIAWSFAVAVHAEYYAGGLLLILVGASVATLPFIDGRTGSRISGTPWQRLSGGQGGVALARARLRVAGPVLAGAILILLGLRLLLESVLNPYPTTGAAPAALMVLVLFGLLIVAGRAMRSAYRRATPAAGVTATARDDQAIAAHLHDSVLQTLALIQRRSHDPVAVAQLARQQERSLRAWLAGRDDRSEPTLARAVRGVAREVEDEESGAVIEVVTVGDAPLSSRADAVVRAAREAMRNAVRHGGAAAPVRVFLEVEGGSCEVYVRDSGAGFDLATVGEARRGVRDAIIGRMQHAGGEAVIDSGPGGTEIALRMTLPASSPAAGPDPVTGR